MKKDMGGAAHALALATLIMGARLPVRLHLLIPAVENAVSGEAFRPGDIIRSRKGMFVEIDNTDAEGRLILADALTKAADAVEDPMWRMPLWDPYQEMLKSDLADVANASNSPMAGCITAALFLKRFVPDDLPWAHLDTYAWRDQAAPGRPKGGEALGLRAVFSMLERRFSAV